MFKKFKRLYNYLKTVRLFLANSEIYFSDELKFCCQYPENIPGYIKKIKANEFLGNLVIEQLLKDKEPMILFPINKKITKLRGVDLNFEFLELYALKIKCIGDICEKD
jgi:hypothetical protein